MAKFRAITVEYNSKSADRYQRDYTYLVSETADVKVGDTVIVPVKGRHTLRATVRTVSTIVYQTAVGKVVEI